MDRLFLDANILFSAAYREDSGLRQFWRLEDVELITSAYAIQEAWRNLDTHEQRERLQELLGALETAPESDISLPAGVELADKDIPILRAALAAEASHLVTGDRKDFGRYFGETLGGVRVTTPRQYLESRKG